MSKPIKNKVELICKFCKKPFFRWKCQIKKSVFCSRKCRSNVSCKKNIICEVCGKEFYVYNYRKNEAKFCSKLCHTKSGCFTRKGKKNKKSHIDKIREKAVERVKNGTHNFWKGGKTNERAKIYNSIEYKNWRKSVFERDDYTCQECGLKFIKGETGNVVLQADHIKPQSIFPELRFDIDNGRTLCIDCHRKTDTWGIKQRDYLKELNLLK